MYTRWPTTVVILLWLLIVSAELFSQTCIPAENQKKGALENLYQISDNLYRCEQPRGNDWNALAENGNKTIINFRRRQSDRDAEGTSGLTFVHLPMRAGKIRYEKVVECLRMINESPNPTIVHCLHGSDRTGCVVACYRMVFCGWTREQAIAEFLDPRFGYHRFWFPGIVKFLEEVDTQKMKSDIENKK